MKQKATGIIRDRNLCQAGDEELFFLPSHSPSARMTLEHFWQDSSLGSPKDWPYCLKITLANMFASVEAQCLLWGEEQYFFYNDVFAFQFAEILAAIPYCGAPIREWPEQWSTLAQDVAKTLKDRAGFKKDSRLQINAGDAHDLKHYFSYSGSPIHDIRGEVKGCLLNFNSLNPQHVRERRLNTLFDLASAISYSSSVEQVLQKAMTIFRENLDDFRYVLFLSPEEDDHWRLKEWSGFSTDPSETKYQLEGRWDNKRFSAIDQSKILFHFFRDHVGTSEMFCSKIKDRDEAYSACLMFGLQPEFQFDDDYLYFIERISGVLRRSIQGAEDFVRAQCEQRSYREQLEQSQAQLELAVKNANEANRLKTSFLANMSHEIRTPLSAILGYSELLSESVVNPIDAEYLRIINKNGKEMSYLIDDILDLSKIEAGKLSIELRPFSLFELVQEVRTLFDIKAARKNIYLAVRFAAGLPNIIVSDRSRLRQIMINVIGNAIKFTQNGGVNIEILANDQSHGRVRVHMKVTDTGIGLDESQRSDLFQPFMQLDHTRSGNFGGTGLGLALSRRLARALGGDLTIEGSGLGEGCTFVIDFEAEIAKDYALSEQNSLSSSFGNNVVKNYFLQNLKILVVDDSPDNRFLLARMLKYQGAEIIEASDGQEAVERAMRDSFDVVLMDIQMPRMDGYSALEELRKRNFGKPIIALTAHAMKEDREKMLMAGFNGHVAKPVNQALLFESIRNQLT